jgi:hypothetical protein
MEVRLGELYSKLGPAGGRENQVAFRQDGTTVRTLRLVWQCGSDDAGVRLICHADRGVPYEPNYGWPQFPIVDENSNDITDGPWEFSPCPVHAALFD